LLFSDANLSHLHAWKLEIDQKLSTLRRLQTLILDFHGEVDEIEGWATKMLLNIQKQDKETKYLKVYVTVYLGTLPEHMYRVITLAAQKGSN